MITLELTDDEYVALTVMIGAGLGGYLDDTKLTRLFQAAADRTPKAAFDGLTRKLEAAAEEYAKKVMS